MDLRTRLQEHLGDAFRIERELGGGGMSRVFVATEVRLSRKVVIKVLSPELAQGLNAERFEREILMAASLQQANIVPVLSAGDMDGLPWFSMPYVDGESLRNRIGGGMPLDDVITILRDVTKALAYAHQRGIAHRDIKPDNVLLSGGTAVVTDFGIAKALAASQRPEGDSPRDLLHTITQLGTSIGTPAYMAPEQVAGDPHLDHRVDLYSLGCMAFEMLTGKPPYADLSPQRLLAAHLGGTPAAVESLRPDCPPGLALLVSRLLQKDPADRPADALTVLKSLGAVSTTSSESARLSPRGRLIRSLLIWAAATLVVWIVARAAVVGIGLPSWTVTGAVGVMLLGLPVLLATGWAKWMARRAASATPTLTPGGTAAPRLPSGTMATIAIKANRHLSFRRATRGGIYAMGAFILLITGFMVTRAMGIGPAASLFAAGTLKNQDRILLADFTMGAGDTALAPIIHEAVRAAMSQSTAVRLLDASDVAKTLSQMQRPDSTRIEGDVARELAQRAGARAILGGRLVRGTDGYFLSVELTDAGNGSVLASVQERAKGDDELLESVDRAAKEVRSKIGESLRQVQRAVPLAQATTASLPALRLYTQAVYANNVEGDLAGAERDLREALKLDSTFALAWRKLAVALFNQEAPQAAIDSAIEQGFRYADRLPPVERNLVKGFYYERHSSRADRSKALEAYRAVLAVDSLNLTAASQMGFEHYFRGDYDSAVVYAALKLR
ncbi:MAG TPA: serine/threonine-protein kinase, partial [Methylomirabilota bacterium]|nr:serine/threonine-protein kinase [Methylomirabilota bacterium]